MIKQEEYQERRKRLMNEIGGNTIVIMRSADMVMRSNDTAYSYRQNSYFYYLTGLEEPNAVLVLTPGDKDEYHLFLRPNCYEEELWDGARAGLDGAKANFLAERSYDISAFDETILTLLQNKQILFYLLSEDKMLSKSVPLYLGELAKKKRKGIDAPGTIQDVAPILSEMRLIKSESERELLRKVCDISSHAHVNAMKMASTATYEYQLHAGLMHDFMRKGCQSVAYDAIVGAGKNACVLHYIKNNEAIEDNALILIDAGGEYHNYAADITRTFPAKGHFTEEQKQIYNLVLQSQLEAIALVKPGVCWTAMQEKIIDVLTQGLCELGILKEDKDTCIKNESYKQFYMHNSGHWLGLDVHDVGSYKEKGQWRNLKEGMVLTIEPGLYIANHHKEVDPRWHNIGIRIEDDILVTATGAEVLTDAVPKSIEEIEALMQAA